MAHTLSEQTYTFVNTSTSYNGHVYIKNELIQFFVEKLGWTADGDKVISNVDTSFWFTMGATNIDGWNFVTVKGMAGNNIMYTAEIFNIYYHISKNEKTIYLRFDSNVIISNTTYRYQHDIIIAYDDNNKATVYYMGFIYKNTELQSGNKSIVYTLDSNNAAVSLKNTGEVKGNLDNALYRSPNYRGHSLCSELYTVVSVQNFSSVSNTYINTNNQIYRVVKCTIAPNSSYYVPTFAFPVSD